MLAASTLLGLFLAVVAFAVLVILEPPISPNFRCCSHWGGENTDLRRCVAHAAKHQ